MACDLLNSLSDEVSVYVSSVASRFNLRLNEYVSRIINDFKVSSINELMDVSQNLIYAKRIIDGIGLVRNKLLTRTDFHESNGLLSEQYVKWILK